MNSYAKFGGATRRRFIAIHEKPEGGGRITAPPPDRARVKAFKTALMAASKVVGREVLAVCVCLAVFVSANFLPKTSGMPRWKNCAACGGRGA